MPISSFAKWQKDQEKKHRADGRQITPDERKAAYDMGVAGYNSGKKAPAQDQQLHNMLFRGVDGGDKFNHYWRIDMMDAWSKGWNDTYHAATALER